MGKEKEKLGRDFFLLCFLEEGDFSWYFFVVIILFGRFWRSKGVKKNCQHHENIPI